MIHTVFQEADIATLQRSFALDKSLQGEVIQITDDYAVGPLQEIYSGEGILARKQWWKEVLAGGDDDGLPDHGTADDQKTVAGLMEKLKANPEEQLWIWAAQNKHDVSGYYWLISQLADFQGRILILYLNNLPFISENGTIFYPVNLFQIPPREFLKAKKLARVVTTGEFDMDTEEWKRLCSENKEVRILEGGKKLVQYDADFYDNELLGFLQANWQKASRFLNRFMNKAKHTTGDAYLLWRLKKMIQSQQIDYQGELKNMRDFDVKLKAVVPAELPC